MRSMIRHALLASAALTLLAGCAQLSVQTDYNPARPLPPLPTWPAMAPPLPVSPHFDLPPSPRRRVAANWRGLGGQGPPSAR